MRGTEDNGNSTAESNSFRFNESEPLFSAFDDVTNANKWNLSNVSAENPVLYQEFVEVLNKIRSLFEANSTTNSSDSNFFLNNDNVNEFMAKIFSNST